tara:strand:+ start:1271 stop:2077 length:807 start_codon:yes stop_codon:yes gene_type:complete
MNKFSVLTSIYKSEPHLKTYFKTIFSQIILPSEIVLVDDTKNPINIDEIIEQQKRIYNFNNIKLIKNIKNLGPARSLNKGLKFCSYNLIFRLDVDDEWKNSHTFKMLEFYEKNKNYLIYSNSLKKQNFLTNLKCDKYFINENHLIHSSWMINRNICKNFKYRMETPSVALEDYFSILYYKKKGFNFFYTYKKTTLYNYVEGSHGKMNLANKKYLKMRKMISRKFFHFHLINKSLFEKINFIFFKFGLIKTLIFLLWIQDYIGLRKLIK